MHRGLAHRIMLRGDDDTGKQRHDGISALSGLSVCSPKEEITRGCLNVGKIPVHACMHASGAGYVGSNMGIGECSGKTDWRELIQLVSTVCCI